MVSADKKLDAMRANPKADWCIEDFETIAKAYDMRVRKSGGSHAVFSHSGSAAHITVPARRPIKPRYVREFVAMVDEIREEQ